MGLRGPDRPGHHRSCSRHLGAVGRRVQQPVPAERSCPGQRHPDPCRLARPRPGHCPQRTALQCWRVCPCLHAGRGRCGLRVPDRRSDARDTIAVETAVAGTAATAGFPSRCAAAIPLECDRPVHCVGRFVRLPADPGEADRRGQHYARVVQHGQSDLLHYRQPGCHDGGQAVRRSTHGLRGLRRHVHRDSRRCTLPLRRRADGSPGLPGPGGGDRLPGVHGDEHCPCERTGAGGLRWACTRRSTPSACSLAPG